MSRTQNILVVDDEPRNQRIILESIADMAEVTVASSGEEALRLIETQVPDLLLLDIMMPGMDGYRVCREIRANPRLKHTKVVLVSGKAMMEEKLKGYEVGADDYITKPFVSEELLAKTKVFLRLAALERDLEEQVQSRTRQLLEAEAKLVSAAKMSALGEMAGGIAHEINTPLGTISLLADQIQEYVQDESIDRKSIGEMITIIGNTVRRIGAIVHGLRTFSRDGSLDRLEPASVKQIVEKTLILCAEKLKYTNIKVEILPIDGELEILCRPVQISQVLLNLINNACDAVGELTEKWITISVDRQDPDILISVTDSGEGIPAAVREKLFHPFFTTKDIGKGTGLGLSISKGILDAHQGTLSVDLACPNTRFIVRVPAAPEKCQVAPSGRVA